MVVAMRIEFGVLVGALAMIGCGETRYVTPADGVDLRADKPRTEVVHVPPYYSGEVLTEEKGSVRIRYGSREGWIPKSALWVYDTPSPTTRPAAAYEKNRRMVVAAILAKSDVPSDQQQLILDRRVSAGMTKKMVELAWGLPTRTESVADPFSSSEVKDDVWAYVATRIYQDDFEPDWVVARRRDSNYGGVPSVLWRWVRFKDGRVIRVERTEEPGTFITVEPKGGP
jgi:hypothetical protein